MTFKTHESLIIRRTGLSLIACLLCANCQIQKPQEPPTELSASFAYSPASPVAGQPIQFTDTSTGSPTSWEWAFGDGATSTTRNPSHTYAAAGSYGVTLTIRVGTGSNSASRTVTVVSEPAGYYIDANNPSASDSNAGTESLPWKTITKANQALVAGDTVYIKAGTYTSYIVPTRSGTESSRIIYRAYGSDVVTIQNASYGISLNGKSYITVQGINFYNLDRFMYLENGANHNIIAYCNFNQGRNMGWAGSLIYRSSQYNWIHHCQFSKYGSISGSASGTVLDIGDEESTTDATRYNLIEDNVMFHGGHHVIGVMGKFNVVRNNYLHNEAWSNGSGYRIFYMNGYAANSGWNLIEGNRIGYAGAFESDNNSAGILLASVYNIVRRNLFYYNDGSAIAMSANSNYISDIVYNKIYNNSFMHNGWDADMIPDAMTSAIGFAVYGGSWIVKYNQIKNNIYYDHYQVYGQYGSAKIADQTYAGNWDGDKQGNPLFVNGASATPTNSALPDLSLQAGSPCIGAGGSLTTITSTSGNGTTFTVADASYFMDGWGISGVEGDEIQIVGTSQRARIVQVNYVTNTITLASSLTWTQNQGITLAYAGSAPDAGAFEYGSQQAPSKK